MKFLNWFIVCLGLVIIVLGASLLPSIDVNNDITTTFKARSGLISEFDSLDNYFQRREEPIIISFTSDEVFDSKEKWLEIKEAQAEIGNLFPEDSTYSILNVQLKKKVGINWVSKPLIYLKGDSLSPNWKKTLDSYQYLAQPYLSEDYKTVNIFYFTEEWSEAKEQKLVSEIERIVNDKSFVEGFVFGEVILNNHVQEMVLSDLYSLALYGFIIILLLFYTFFRSVKVIIVIGFITAINVNATILLMYVADLEFNILTSIVPTIISILSVTDLNHIIFATSQQNHQSERSRVNVREALVKLRRTLIVTSATTAIGFGIFLFNDIDNLRVFALISILGIALSLANVFIFLPAAYKMLSPIHTRVNPMASLIIKINFYVSQHYKKISYAFIIILMFIVSGVIISLKIDYNPRSNLNSSSNFAQNVQFYDESFNNTKSISVIVAADSGVAFDDQLNQMAQVDSSLALAFPNGRVYSVFSFIKSLNQAINKGEPSSYRLPAKYDSTWMYLIQNDSIITPYVYEPSKSLYKFIVQTNYDNASSSQFSIDHFERSLHDKTAGVDVQCSIGGDHYSEDLSAVGLVQSVLTGLLISMALISLFTAVFYRKAALFIITFLVNLFPISLSLLTVVILHGYINPSIVIILSIAFGIALDDTMYFISKLRKVSDSHSNMFSPQSIKINIADNVFPMVSTSLILSGSFCALLFSSFEVNLVNAFVLILTLLIAMFSDLIILPALLLFAILKKQKSNEL